MSTASRKPAAYVLTVNSGEKNKDGSPVMIDHEFPMNEQGVPVIKGEAQLAEYLKAGGDPLVNVTASVNRPVALPSESVYDNTKELNSKLVDKAIAESEHRHEEPGFQSLLKQFDAVIAYNDSTKTFDDKEQEAEYLNAATCPEDEYNALCWDAWARARKIGFDLVRIEGSVPFVIVTQFHGDVTFARPPLALRFLGTTYDYMVGTLPQINDAIERETRTRAKKAHLEKIWSDYAEDKRREMAESVANSPAVKFAAQEAELAELKRKDAERDAEMAAMRYQLRTINDRV